MKTLFAASLAAALMLSACANTFQDKPKAAAPKGSNPAVEAALQECRQSVGATADRAAFDACMKAKGFERPTPKDQPDQLPPPVPASAPQ